MKSNTPVDSNLYNITHWGEGYFNINDKGNIEITKIPGQVGVELSAIVDSADKAGLHLPLLIRCSDILHDRVRRIYQAFHQAIELNDYAGSYQLVYPIKVNQEQSVVRELLKAPGHSIGLEAGSKPELMAVIGMLGTQQSTIICNGYKDSGYIRTALIAQQMGHKVFIVIEKKSELEIILNESARMNIKPTLGVRIRLVSKALANGRTQEGSSQNLALTPSKFLS